MNPHPSVLNEPSSICVSALAAAILSSSLTGRTIALPPARPRSFSESDYSRSETHTTFEPYASTALYTRDGEPESLAGRPRLPSPGLSEDHDDEEEEEEDLERSVLSDEDGHVYQSLDRRGKSPTRDRYDIYARPVKQVGRVWTRVLHCTSCVDQTLTVAPPVGEQAELLSLRQQAQEVVDENDSLKMTVHRLNVELSRYQTRFRPLGKEESSRTHGLPLKGSAPPWLLDMKYLSPLLLSYEDRLTEKDTLLQASEVRVLSGRSGQEVVCLCQENQKLHLDLSGTDKEERQLQEQARLVLQENQVLIEQLEVQHTKAKDSHGRHLTEVSKVCKQLMLLEAEKQRLEGELEVTRRELHTLQTEHLQARCSLENAVSWDEHHAIADSGRQQTELEELQQRVTSLQTEKNSLLLDKTNLTADIKSLEADLEVSRHANRKAQRRIGLLKQQVDDSIDKEMRAHHYLSSIVALAEKTTQERDQLVYMASSLEHDKQGVISRIVEDTVRLGKLQEKVKVYKKQAACSLGVLGQRLVEQEEDFSGRAASYQTEIQHLQRLLRDKQHDLDGVLQQKRYQPGKQADSQ
uniref:Uncharacterized protein n=1 Tax=Oncorhynchus tshawytscha TaxID=74940 RepID=A0AAZ3PPU2_ONCTS